jgi:hypothetical protein
MITQKLEEPFRVFIIDDLYSDKELTMFSDYVIQTSDKNRCFTNSPFKNGKMIEPEISGLMYDRIKTHLPNEYVDLNGFVWTFRKSVKYIFYSEIKNGQMFGIHTDTGSEYNAVDNLFSKFTVLTYLNDNFEGGKTTFYDHNFIETTQIQPKRGRTLVFDIDLYHKGEMVTKGIKQWIGTELVCFKSNFSDR